MHDPNGGLAQLSFMEGIQHGIVDIIESLFEDLPGEAKSDALDLRLSITANARLDPGYRDALIQAVEGIRSGLLADGYDSKSFRRGLVALRRRVANTKAILLGGKLRYNYAAPFVASGIDNHGASGK